MQKLVMVVGLVMGLVAGACDAYQFNEEAPLDDGADVIKDGDPHLPGSCNTIVCDTPNQNPHGENPTYCQGCDCAASPSSCRSCVMHCRADWYRCLGRDDTTQEGCDLVYGASCEQHCGPEGTCVCPRP